jgi:hypothetical protein
MRPRTTDPTAGETARAIGLNPAAVRRIGDPTNRRYRNTPPGHRNLAADWPRIVDPTDLACGQFHA